MVYNCFVGGEKIYTFDSTLDDEDDIDFLLAAEEARNNTDSDESSPEKIQIDVVSSKGTKKEFIVRREMCPTYIARLKEECNDC